MRVVIPIKAATSAGPQSSLTSFGQGLAPISPALAEFLLPKLPGGGTRQFRQGKAATEALDTTRQQRLWRDNGSERSLFLRVADERIDRYARLLAYEYRMLEKLHAATGREGRLGAVRSMAQRFRSVSIGGRQRPFQSAAPFS